MKRTTYQYILFLMLCTLFKPEQLYSQGCSDAGICSIHPSTPHVADTAQHFPALSIRNHSLAAGITHGLGENKTIVNGVYIDYFYDLGEQFSLNTKFQLLNAIGTLAKTFEPGDVFINLSYRKNNNLSITLGTKIPMNDGNLSEAGKPLPMPYQTSLGTLDMLGALTYSSSKWFLTLGVQLPLTQNQNRFLKESSTLGADAATYFTTNNYVRKPDIMGRVTYVFSAYQNKLQIMPGILPVVHLANDLYKDTAGVQREISGSQGLTLNVTLILRYKLSGNKGIELSFGAPLIARTARPDGLTRAYALGIEYKLLF